MDSADPVTGNAVSQDLSEAERAQAGGNTETISKAVNCAVPIVLFGLSEVRDTDVARQIDLRRTKLRDPHGGLCLFVGCHDVRNAYGGTPEKLNRAVSAFPIRVNRRR